MFWVISNFSLQLSPLKLKAGFSSFINGTGDLIKWDNVSLAREQRKHSSGCPYSIPEVPARQEMKGIEFLGSLSEVSSITEYGVAGCFLWEEPERPSNPTHHFTTGESEGLGGDLILCGGAQQAAVSKCSPVCWFAVCPPGPTAPASWLLLCRRI